MLYAIAAILVALLVLALLGKPIRIEIIHTVTQIAAPDEHVGEVSKDPRGNAEMDPLAALKYINEVFHNVGEDTSHGTEQ